MDDDRTQLRISKRALRAEIKEKVERCSDRAHRSALIISKLKTLQAVKSAKAIMIYLNLDAEVHTFQFVQELIDQNRVVVVPYCKEKYQLGLFRLEHLSELSQGKHGIHEPREGLLQVKEKLIHPSALDVVILPGVAFDPNFNRLGRGAGYYDRFLSTLRPTTLTIGLGFAFQLVDLVPREPHDIPLSAVITDSEIIMRSSNSEIIF